MESLLIYCKRLGFWVPFIGAIAGIDLGSIGYWIVGSFVAAWLLSVLVWRLGRYEKRFSSGIEETQHTHDPSLFEI